MKLLVTGGSGFIGQHVMRAAEINGIETLDVDIRNVAAVDIRDADALRRVFDAFRPTHVLNLAADTTLEYTSLHDYTATIDGTACLVRCCNQTPSVVRFVHVSTQHVCRTASRPDGDEDFQPDTLYALSKVMSEKTVRNLCEVEWVIARPTNVWGPSHPHLADGFWRALERGYYLHPAGSGVRRGYGYVENVVDQLLCLLHANCGDVNGRVFYVSEPAIDQAVWVDAFAVGLTGSPARRVPRLVLAAGAVIGDALHKVGVESPLYWSRYKSMVKTQDFPHEPTVALCGPARIGMAEGVAATIDWFHSRK